MTKFGLFILGNGRKAYLERTIASWEENLIEKPDYRIIFDDSGDSHYREWLLETFGDRYDIASFDTNPVGQAKALNVIFEYLKNVDVEYFIQLEEDWVLFRKLNVNDIFNVMKKNPDVVQMRIPRTIWYSNYHHWDILSGSLLLDYINNKKASYTFHDNWFSLQSNNYFWSHNPNVFHKNILNQSYNIQNQEHEYHFGIDLLNNNPNAKFGIWADNPYDGYVTHIGIRNEILLKSLPSHERIKY